MGLFKKKATDPGELVRLKAEISAMAQRLDRHDADKNELGNTVRGIVTRLDTPIAPPPEPPTTSSPMSTPPPPEPGPPVATQADIDMLNARVQRLGDRIDGIDARITSIATELANQLEELATEVGSVSTAPISADGDSDEVAAQAASAAALASAAEAIAVEIREAQTKLANEQARYQIAFRQDLADLAERLKRS